MATWRRWVSKLFGGGSDRAPAAAAAPPVLAPTPAYPPLDPEPALFARRGEEIPPIPTEPSADIGATPEARELQAAIAEAPGDPEPQLVLADLLLGAEDPRGELIVLHRRDVAGELDTIEALDRYLFLGALFSFPRALPEEPPLAFIEVTPTVFSVAFEGHYYTVRYADRRVRIEADTELVLERPVRLASSDRWTAAEATFVLRHIGDAIRARAPLVKLELPFGKRPLPNYGAGPLRCYRVPAEFRDRHGLAPHEVGLAARDYHHWFAVWRRLSRRLSAG